MTSLNRRMLVGASLVLFIFIFLTGYALDRAFRDSAHSARQERLQGLLYLLVAQAEVDAQGHLIMPEQLSEASFNYPDSGLYATITDSTGAVVWQSPSVLGVNLPNSHALSAGVKQSDEPVGPSGQRYFSESIGVNWRIGSTVHAFTFTVLENHDAFDAQIRQYRSSLSIWLSVMSLIMLIVQGALLRWGLRPLRRVAMEVARIESGRQEQIRGNYPREITRLTDNINVLLKHERARQKRYRDALGDLAHSLKTPLALMRATLEEVDPHKISAAVEEETERMSQIVAYHLQRASAMSGATLGTSTGLAPAAARILRSLDKVYADKGVVGEMRVPENATLPMQEDDLMEILGNLLDNAYKWCKSRVRISFTAQGREMRLLVEDDGPGIEDSRWQLVLERGARLDETVPGHGIGLAVVKDVMAAYEGEVTVSRSELGGAAFCLSWHA